jgi:hypothetical protein
MKGLLTVNEYILKDIYRASSYLFIVSYESYLVLEEDNWSALNWQWMQIRIMLCQEITKLQNRGRICLPIGACTTAKAGSA